MADDWGAKAAWARYVKALAPVQCLTTAELIRGKACGIAFQHPVPGRERPLARR